MYNQINNDLFIKIFIKRNAHSENRTRIDCLEGNHTNLYTKCAFWWVV